MRKREISLVADQRDSGTHLDYTLLFLIQLQQPSFKMYINLIEIVFSNITIPASCKHPFAIKG